MTKEHCFSNRLSTPELLRSVACSNCTRAAKLEQIRNLLDQDDGCLLWSVVKLYDQQSEDEKQTAKLLYKDRRGFGKVDFSVFMVIGRAATEKGYLRDEQKATCRARNDKGRTRIGKYAAQLLALILAEACPEKLTPRLARLVPPLRKPAGREGFPLTDVADQEASA